MSNLYLRPKAKKETKKICFWRFCCFVQRNFLNSSISNIYKSFKKKITPHTLKISIILFMLLHTLISISILITPF